MITYLTKNHVRFFRLQEQQPPHHSHRPDGHYKEIRVRGKLSNGARFFYFPLSDAAKTLELLQYCVPLKQAQASRFDPKRILRESAVCHSTLLLWLVKQCNKSKQSKVGLNSIVHYAD